MADFFDMMSSSGRVSDYTLEEIEAAEKRMRKMGGSLQANLEAVTGRKPGGAKTLPGALKAQVSAMEQQLRDLEEQAKARLAQPAAPAQSQTPQPAQPQTPQPAQQQSSQPDAAEAASGGPASAAPEEAPKPAPAYVSPNEVLLQNSREIDRQLQELNQSLAQDFGVGASAASAGTETSAAAVAQPPLPTGEEALESFRGVKEEATAKVFGQDEFVGKLVIAMKRPFVMPPEGTKARNAILLIGKNDTGKHIALETLAGLLKDRGILRSPEVRKMDLSLYQDASMEKIFLQDLYAALASPSDVLLFEHLENCHPSFLVLVSQLVTNGSVPLSERYILQKGQLVNVQNSLASETVSSLTPQGKYLVFLTEKSVDKVAGLMGAPFVDALGDLCETKDLEEDALRKITESELEELKKKALDQFSFRIAYDDGFLEECVSHSARGAGLRGVQDHLEDVLRALAQAKLEGEYPKETEFTIGVSNGKLYAKGSEGELDLSALLPDSYRGEIDEIRREMDEIVGLTEVKKYILSLEEYYRVQKRRAEEGLKAGEVSKHMIFTGNPGTGKTTIARIVSKYLKAIGVLSGGQLVEVSRADLVGRYVGHTAPLTNKVISSAIGGVLFIDEAYSLYRGGDDTFGLEAVDTLVKGIEDNRENLIVILAGYSMEMQEFLTSNSGLKSRFPNVIDFPDYTGEELLQISRCIAKSKGYRIDEGADEALKIYFNGVQMTRAADAGNGRLARNLVEEAILNQSRRLAAEPEADLSLLLLSDFELAEEKSL
ncbi:MAG: AAA family ATPase [Lachnospiraceae bacterium]|nr:AAA family ATPase [Lachnospiraceae bacterium]